MTDDARLENPASPLLSGIWWGLATFALAVLALVDSVSRVVRDASPYRDAISTGFWDRLSIFLGELRFAFVPLLLVALLVAEPRGRRWAVLAVAAYLLALVISAIYGQTQIDSIAS
jgi:hypothetical protein